MKFAVTVCREVWGTITVEAEDGREAISKVCEGDYDEDFIPNGSIGNEGVYNAHPVEEVSAE
jgi:hypothetical protein